MLTGEYIVKDLSELEKQYNNGQNGQERSAPVPRVPLTQDLEMSHCPTMPVSGL